MKLLINLCAHDGIISHYNGVGTMCIRYIECISKILDEMSIDYQLNLFTPEYKNDSFGYDSSIKEKHSLKSRIKIYEIDNGSNGYVNYGTIDNWKKLCQNTAKIINEIDYSKYDQVLSIYNDTPFACLANYLNNAENHK